jgi:hypothetical protein
VERQIRSSNIIHDSFQTSSKNSHVNGELSDSKKNVDEELRVPLVVPLKA